MGDQQSFHVAAGDERSSVILHVPHSSRVIPPGVRRSIVLDDTALAEELDRMTDVHTDVVAEQVAAAVTPRPWVFANRLSRLVVDPERFPDEREELRSVGMGAVYTRTSHGRPLRSGADEASLLKTYFQPYASAFTELVDDRLRVTGRAVIVDVHSYPVLALPYELHGDGPRPPVCLGTDTFHTPQSLVDGAGEVLGEVALNTPFAGCYVPLKHYGRDARVSAIMIEIRRDQDPTTIAGALARLLVAQH